MKSKMKTKVENRSQGRSFAIRFVAAFLAINILTEIIFPTLAMALTSGPSQPETQGFEPITTNQMVDLFSGDFTYNIPLFNLPGKNGGYPFNMAYHSGISMDQEASWVGLGWSLTPGAINKEVRGLADDYNGDQIYETVDMKGNTTIGGSLNYDLDFVGDDVSKIIGGGNISLRVYNNNYKGWGMGLGIGGSLGFGSKNSHFKGSVDIGIDSQNGGSIGAGVSMSKTLDGDKDRSGGLGLGLSLNSKEGLGVNYSFNQSKKREKGESRTANKHSNFGIGGNMTFSSSAYTPVMNYATTSVNLTGSATFGVAAPTIYNGFGGGVFWTEEWLNDAGKQVPHSSYGYNYLEQAPTDAITDYQRENDGVATDEMPNLPSTQLTYDTYQISGQGNGGTFRPFRSDYGHIFHPYKESSGAGGDFHFREGFGTDEFWGISGCYNWTYQKSGDWTAEDDNQLYSELWFNNSCSVPSDLYEKIYYKSHGEMTFMNKSELDNIGGEKPVRGDVQFIANLGSIEGLLSDGTASGTVSDNNGNSVNTSANRWQGDNQERVKRNTDVLCLTNAQINNLNAFPQYNIHYYDLSNVNNYHSNNFYTSPVDRNNRTTPIAGSSKTTTIKDHVGAITTTNADGLRYNYSLPTYNNVKREYLYSVAPSGTCSKTVPVNQDLVSGKKYQVDGTDQFLKRTEYPAYATGYLLTSILGTDYIDADETEGPSDGDFGYWVKFNYVKTSGNYQWRGPFKGAQYGEGAQITATDDKASFEFGEKEMWYLATVESSTHIAVFNISKRHDGIDATEFDDVSNSPNYTYKLDRIDLYTKQEYNNPTSSNGPVPLQSVHFEYDYSQCAGTALPNNDKSTTLSSNEETNTGGKLTLKKVWFTYQNSDRGRLSPYEFTYAAFNPSYSQDNYDRWGGYKEYYQANQCDWQYFPYVDQVPNSKTSTSSNPLVAAQEHKATMDKWASAWELTQIKLPSGGAINLTYESDDYGYVQHKEATQMFKISALGYSASTSKIYDNDTWDDGVDANQTLSTVYFDLEAPVSAATYSTADAQFKNKYLTGLLQDDGSYQLYFKIHSNLRGSVSDYVSGYAEIDMSSAYGMDASTTTTIGGDTYYTRGFVTIKSVKVDFWTAGTSSYYHPFAFASWQYMKANQPDLISSNAKFSPSQSNTSGSDLDKVVQASSIVSSFGSFAEIFSGFTGACFNNNYGSSIDLDNSYIKLNSPDRIKYGGGSRIKQVSISDQWGDVDPKTSEPIVYGQTYDYTTTDDNNTIISSGVASYEPVVGGDENTLHYAKAFNKDYFWNFNVAEHMYTEFPMMEPYFPGPSVGYSKVTVMSLASQNALNNALSTSPDASIAARAKSGVVVNEFYTYKDFPVIVEQTDINKKPFDKWIPIPFIGMYDAHNLTASQGYSIKLNDMHGKPRAVTTYGQKSSGGINVDRMISQVSYLYRANNIVYQNKSVMELDNELDPGEVITSGNMETDPNNSGAQRMTRNSASLLLGEEYDYFADMKRSYSESGQAGIAFSTDLIFYWIPALEFWPSFSFFANDYRAIVINKVISKAGILKQIIATDGQSSVSTENKLYDLETGEPVLAVVNNNYDSPVYNYSIPAHWYYSGMSSAYKNSGLEFCATVVSGSSGLTLTVPNPTDNNNCSCTQTTDGITFSNSKTGDFLSVLQPGDELIFVNQFNQNTQEKAIVTGVSSSVVTIADATGFLNTGATYNFKVVRSGNRNLLSTKAGSVVALQDPTVNIHSVSTGLAADFANFLTQRLQSCNSSTCIGSNCVINGASGSSLFQNDGGSETSGGGIPLSATILSKYFYYFHMAPTYSGSIINGLQVTFYSNSGNDVTCTLGFDTYCIQSIGVHDANSIQVNYVNGTSFNVDISACLGSYIATYDYTYNVLQASAVQFSDNWQYDYIYGTGNRQDNLTTQSDDATLSLYAIGQKGIWRPQSNYYYKDDRFSSQDKLMYPNPTQELKLWSDGVFQGDQVSNVYDHRFYMFNWSNPLSLNSRWLPNQIITQYNQDGFETENKDILGIYSSSKYGYTGNLVTMVAANAMQKELFYESFDDPSSPQYLVSALLSDAHSGKNSYSIRSASELISISSPHYLFAGKQYVFSAWIKSASAVNTAVVSFTDAGNSQWNNSGTVISFQPSGDVIEGWQRVEGIFTVPTGKSVISKLRVDNSSGSTIDDIRIFPKDAAVTTYVYDPLTFRLQATLDNNNYATFYYYDEQGNLHLTTRETNKGVFTVSENRSHILEH